MFEKKNFLLNCDVCDTRKMKEEDYRYYENIVINADVIIVSETSKSMLNRLPITLNHDRMIEVPQEMVLSIKTVNGDYKITGNTSAAEHTILTVNGYLLIEDETEEILKKYEAILVNGRVKYPKNLEGLLDNMTVNGTSESYPADCVLMEPVFVIDKFFPLRAKERSKYYVEKAVVIKDKEVDVRRLADKNIQFITKKCIVPQSRVEESVSLFDERAELIVVPEGMELVYGDTVLDERLIDQKGSRLFVCGKLTIDPKGDMEALCKKLEKLIVRGTVVLRSGQEEAFGRIDAEYERLSVEKRVHKISHMLQAKIDRKILESFGDGVEVSIVEKVVIADDVPADLILEKLTLTNCVKVICNAQQEGAVCAVAANVAYIGKESGQDSVFGILNNLAGQKMINADTYVM